MKPGLQALGRLPAGTMNKSEALYAEHLDGLKHHGVIAWYKFEGVKLRLADGCFYTPDFVVMLADGQIEMREVKGHWLDDARIKIKVAASIYPFRFLGITARSKKAGGGWNTEVFS